MASGLHRSESRGSLASTTYGDSRPHTASGVSIAGMGNSRRTPGTPGSMRPGSRQGPGSRRGSVNHLNQEEGNFSSSNTFNCTSSFFTRLFFAPIAAWKQACCSYPIIFVNPVIPQQQVRLNDICNDRQPSLPSMFDGISQQQLDDFFKTLMFRCCKLAVSVWLPHVAPTPVLAQVKEPGCSKRLRGVHDGRH